MGLVYVEILNPLTDGVLADGIRVELAGAFAPVAVEPLYNFKRVTKNGVTRVKPRFYTF
jgi:hypothetical protein